MGPAAAAPVAAGGGGGVGGAGGALAAPPPRHHRQPLPGELFAYGGLSCVIAGAPPPRPPSAQAAAAAAARCASRWDAGRVPRARGLLLRPLPSRPAPLPPPAVRPAAAAAVFTNPLDVAKTQLQVQGELARRAAPGGGGAAAAAPPPPRLGMARALAALVRAEGPAALWRGVAPSMLREASYSTIRYGAYDPIK
jgi:hypothetical protein